MLDLINIRSVDLHVFIKTSDQVCLQVYKSPNIHTLCTRSTSTKLSVGKFIIHRMMQTRSDDSWFIRARFYSMDLSMPCRLHSNRQFLVIERQGIEVSEKWLIVARLTFMIRTCSGHGDGSIDSVCPSVEMWAWRCDCGGSAICWMLL